MKKLLLLACGIMLWNACKKDDKEIFPVGRYEGGHATKNAPVALYAKDTVITDTAYIGAFLRRNFITGIYDLAAGTGAYNPVVALNYTGNNNITFNFPEAPSSSGMAGELVQVDNSLSIFKAKDAIDLDSYAGSDAELSCGSVNVKIRKYAPAVDCQTAPGESTVCTGRPQIPLMKSGNDIIVPLLTYSFVTNTENHNCYRANFNVLAIFDNDAVKAIKTGDTLIVQTSELLLKKQ